MGFLSGFGYQGGELIMAIFQKRLSGRMTFLKVLLYFQDKGRLIGITANTSNLNLISQNLIVKKFGEPDNLDQSGD